MIDCTQMFTLVLSDPKFDPFNMLCIPNVIFILHLFSLRMRRVCKYAAHWFKYLRHRSICMPRQMFHQLRLLVRTETSIIFIITNPKQIILVLLFPLGTSLLAVCTSLRVHSPHNAKKMQLIILCK